MLSPLRTTLRTTLRTRCYSTPAAAAAPAASSTSTAAANAAKASAFSEEREAIRHHAAKSGALWRKITFYFAFPAVLVGYLNADSMMQEHKSHVEHIKEENGGELPERINYPYFNKRDKEFPWGANTIFYNPEVNIAPGAAE